MGFGGNDDLTYILAKYLSNQWLASTHINQQLDLLSLDLQRTGFFNCKLMKPNNFSILGQVYWERETVPYQKDVQRHLHGLGEELAEGHQNRRLALQSWMEIIGWQLWWIWWI